ncbi:hypothetical protein L3i23_23130 [Herbiconiux sp. L3-i23]|nr:hypothetical protein L3i23_23130 [Herbiconiux sp. L3-i23]
MPGWKGSNRRAQLPTDWPQIRAAILDRDSHRCQHVRTDTGQRCLRPARQVDHYVPGNDHRPSNLRALCDWHHNQKSGREGGTASVAARRARKPKSPQHPGLLTTPGDPLPGVFSGSLRVLLLAVRATLQVFRLRAIRGLLGPEFRRFGAS